MGKRYEALHGVGGTLRHQQKRDVLYGRPLISYVDVVSAASSIVQLYIRQCQ